MDNLNFNSVENVSGIEARAAVTINSATMFTSVGRGCFVVKVIFTVSAKKLSKCQNPFLRKI